MSGVSYQTIKLSTGKHSSPEKGACVMELASMLAGEPFTDHPVSVCPVIGSLMRAYNDSIDDRRRQDLYRFSSLVVGTASSRDVQKLRASRLAQWTLSMQKGKLRTVLAKRRVARWEKVPNEWIGSIAVRPLRPHTDETHAAVLALIEELIAIGAPTAPGPLTPEPKRSAPAAELMAPAAGR